MYQSIPSLTIPLSGQTPWGVFERVNSRGTKKVQNPDPWGRKIVIKPNTAAAIFKNPAKKQKMR